MSDNIVRDRVRNECIYNTFEVVPLKDKLRENRRRWVGNVKQWWPISVPVRRSGRIVLIGVRRNRDGLNKYERKAIKRT